MALYFQVLSIDRVNKRTFTLGLQNVNPYSEMPDVLSGVSKNHQTTHLVRLHKALLGCSVNAKFHDFFPLFSRLYKHILKSPPEPQCLNVTQTFSKLQPHANSLKKATLAKIMFNWLTKIQWILDWCKAYLTMLTEGELCLDFHTITRPWQIYACCTFLLDTN